MKKYLLVLAASFAAICAVSCGSGNEESDSGSNSYYTLDCMVESDLNKEEQAEIIRMTDLVYDTMYLNDYNNDLVDVLIEDNVREIAHWIANDRHSGYYLLRQLSVQFPDEQERFCGGSSFGVMTEDGYDKFLYEFIDYIIN